VTPRVVRPHVPASLRPRPVTSPSLERQSWQTNQPRSLPVAFDPWCGSVPVRLVANYLGEQCRGLLGVYGRASNETQSSAEAEMCQGHNPRNDLPGVSAVRPGCRGHCGDCDVLCQNSNDEPALDPSSTAVSQVRQRFGPGSALPESRLAFCGSAQPAGDQRTDACDERAELFPPGSAGSLAVSSSIGIETPKCRSANRRLASAACPTPPAEVVPVDRPVTLI
jgi:hypothetical protein